MGKSGFVPDNTNIKKTSGTPNLFFDSKDNILFERDPENVIYTVTSTQIPAMLGGAFGDVYLTKGHIREPHWHPNAWELDVVVSGEAQISIVDPDTKKLHTYVAKPGQVVFIPMGWWHWIISNSEKLHLHLFFNNDLFEAAEGSDMLRLTPPEVFQLAYGVDANKLANALSPIKESVEIGPPALKTRETYTPNNLNQNIRGKSGFVPDNTNIKKSSGTPNLFFDFKNSIFFERNPENILYEVTSTQIPAMLGGSFADLYLTKEHIREPHWHPNAWELDVIVSGEAQISLVDPDTKKIHTYIVKPGQVVFIPMAWWHWIIPKSEKLHVHLFFNNDQRETAEGSDTLRLTPPDVLQLAYGVDAQNIADALAPIKESVIIGPPSPKTNSLFTTNTNRIKQEEVPKQKIEEIIININGKKIKL